MARQPIAGVAVWAHTGRGRIFGLWDTDSYHKVATRGNSLFVGVVG